MVGESWAAGPSTTLVVIPAFNEQASIGEVVKETQTVLPHAKVLVVDDGSDDATARVAKNAGAAVLVLPFNLGVGGALRAGFRYAVRYDYDVAVQVDGDGQHDPAEIPRFVEAFARTGPELVLGRRDFAAMPPVRRISNTLGGWIFSAAVGRRVADNQSGYRLIGRQLMTAMLDSTDSGFAFEVEMIARCIALGLPMTEVPIRTIYAGEPSHIRPWAHLRSFLRVSRDARRIVRGG
jgi:glycosyltransferase involved in cell wall biosynthesis